MCVLTIVLGGVPASGKTHVFRLLREILFRKSTRFEHKAQGDRHAPLFGIEAGPFKMLGVFDGTRYEGTDRLDKAIKDNALDYIRLLESKGERAVVLAEGDRMFNRPFILATKAVPFAISASSGVLNNRRQIRDARGEGHSACFLKSKDTMVANIVRDLNIRTAVCDTNADAIRIAGYLAGRARRWIV